MSDLLPPNFCGQCGGALPRFGAETAYPRVCPVCGRKIYLDPKIAVALIVLNPAGQIALLRRAQEDEAHGRWILPGGHVDRGEELRQAGQREVREELGCEVTAHQLVGIYSYNQNPVILVVYIAHSHNDALLPNREALEARYFEFADIPWAELGYPSTVQALQDFWEQMKTT